MGGAKNREGVEGISWSRRLLSSLCAFLCQNSSTLHSLIGDAKPRKGKKKACLKAPVDEAWSEECDFAFTTLKQKLSSAPSLVTQTLQNLSS